MWHPRRSAPRPADNAGARLHGPDGYNKNDMRLVRIACLLCLAAFARDGVAATWQLSAGATPEESGAVEVSRRSRGWELALGYVGEQRLEVRYITPVCPWEGAPPEACSTRIRDGQQPVDAYAYFSVQRRFELRPGAWLRPVAGIGLVGQTVTNAYVSTPVNFSLSLGLGLGERLALEWRHFSNADASGLNLGQDAVLLRWEFR
jgi:hypothetical protein